MMDYILAHGVAIGLVVAIAYFAGCCWLIVRENDTYAREMARHRRTR